MKQQATKRRLIAVPSPPVLISKPRIPLTVDECDGIVLAVKSAFRKLANLYEEITAGVIARDLSEEIEKSIIQHCSTFKEGLKHADLCRYNRPWEVKICKDSGMTINQSKVVEGESYIVVNYQKPSTVKKIWILWEATDSFFSEKRANSNARTLKTAANELQESIEVIFQDGGRARR